MCLVESFILIWDLGILVAILLSAAKTFRLDTDCLGIALPITDLTSPISFIKSVNKICFIYIHRVSVAIRFSQSQLSSGLLSWQQTCNPDANCLLRLPPRKTQLLLQRLSWDFFYKRLTLNTLCNAIWEYHRRAAKIRCMQWNAAIWLK